jgi:hypothetical protein
MRREPGCPVTWLTPEQFLMWSPFAEFYGPVFTKQGMVRAPDLRDNR